MSMRVKFWGVRGSIACPSPQHMVYGGNTSCIEIECAGHRIILDSGTGIRNLGQALLREGVERVDLMLTHTHWDHINGFPFFGPAFRKGFGLHIRAGHLRDKGGIQYVLANQMANPMFPVPLEAMQASMSFEDFRAGESFALGSEINVRTCPLNHPNGATAYRIEHGGASVCFVTDTEHVPDRPDRYVLDLIHGADLVIYDSTYSDEEFPAKVGWGHSTWQEGIRLCRAAEVKRLAIFHHDPDHDDAYMTELEGSAKKLWDGAFCARDNMELLLGGA